MKTLFLVRHAHSGWHNSHEGDFERPLSERGRMEAKEMALRMRRKGVVPELMVSSPALRAISTADIFADLLGYSPEKIVQKIEIYQGGPGELASIIQAIPEQCGTVLLFGHNPVITMLSSWLSGKSMASMETCGIIMIDLGNRNWSDVKEGCGIAVCYEHP
ncbi:MAG: phosphohistidine phosphatase [Chlorobiaceae bacterium]|nr:phosphohistidine phosphatase [Chlorobiaceae bacterium]